MPLFKVKLGTSCAMAVLLRMLAVALTTVGGPAG